MPIEERLIKRISRNFKIPSIVTYIAEEIAKKFELEEFHTKKFVETLVDNLIETATGIENIILINISEYWYACLLKIYELSDMLSRYGFLVETDVSPSTTYTYNLSLVGTGVTCVCPKFVSCADLGARVKLTNVVNKDITEVEMHWRNKYAARDTPLPTDIPHSLHEGWDYVYFPKLKVQVKFKNTHTSETAHCIFYADYLEINYDYAYTLIKRIYEPMVDQLKEIMLPELYTF
jgi:hypothetical protein